MTYTTEERVAARRASRTKWQRKNRAKEKAWRENNAEKLSAQKREHYALNKQKVVDRARVHRLRGYGITPEDFDEMLHEQNGVCAICKTNTSDRRLDVDHCHATGRVRGLLCRPCNHAVGFLKDDPLRFYSAIEYLKQS
jgi:hypothetical protein